MKIASIMKRLAALIALITCPPMAMGAERAAWIGPGTVSCADFGQACRDDRKGAENLFFSWAQGFMSGLNTELLERGEADLNKLSVAEQKELLRSYCEAHPRAAYFAAVFELYNRLRRDQGLAGYEKIWRMPPSGQSPKTK
jgi:hypothetical protein